MQKIFTSSFFESERNNLVVVFLFAALVMLPILFYGVPFGYDLPHHYQCALTYRDAILAGDFYPSWTTLRNLGFGSMELRLYPPVSHYVLALFSLLTGEWFLATWLTFTFWWIVGSAGVYLWAREVFPAPATAVVAAIVYAVMPYRLNQAYLVFFYGELAGTAIVPFCFAFLARILRERETTNQCLSQKENRLVSLNVVGLAVSYALLILTHLPLTLIVSLALAIYFLVSLRFDLKASLIASARFAIAVLLGLAASSFFWIKVFQERALLAKTAIYEDVFLNYRLNFLLTIFQQYNDAAEVVYENFTLVYDIVLLVTLITIIPIALLAIIFRKSKKNRQIKSLWTTFLIALFLTTPASKFIWDNLSLLQEVQFPWRWLTVVSLFAPMLFAAGFPILLERFADRKSRPFALILIGTFVIGGFFGLNQSIRGALYKEKTETESLVAEVGQREGLTFWWTKFARKEVFENTEKVIAGNREVLITNWQPTSRTFQISDGNPAFVRIATFYHPNWQVTINGVSAESKPDKTGAIQILIPSQALKVDLRFEESTEVKTAKIISIFTWLFLLVLLVISNLMRFKKSSMTSEITFN